MFKANEQLQLFFKRSFDVAISLVGLILLAIPFAVVAVAIKLDSKGSIFFRQERVGQHGRRFRVWKFRTMIEGAESTGTGIRTSAEDPRITRVGRRLRRLGLDELPQLLNVVRGEMSLVGPRPTVPSQVAAYTERERQRLAVKPGITGLTIIKGRNSLSWPERIEVDLEYVENWAFSLDMKILLLTPWYVLIRRSGVYCPTDNEKQGGASTRRPS